MKVATIFWSVVGYSTLVAGILQDGASNATGDAIQQWQAIAGYVPGSNVADTVSQLPLGLGENIYVLLPWI